MSLVETYSHYGPFYGTILAGVFTRDSIVQLESLRFTVLYFPYPNIVRAFQTANIEASFNEETPDVEFANKVAAWEALSDGQKLGVASALIDMHEEEIATFVDALKRAVTRQIELIRVLPLYGSAFTGQSIEEAIAFIENYREDPSSARRLVRYEVEIRYINEDVIKANFQDRERVLEYLHTHVPARLLSPEQLQLFDEGRN